jgi:hypothetical protein
MVSQPLLAAAVVCRSAAAAAHLCTGIDGKRHYFPSGAGVLPRQPPVRKLVSLTVRNRLFKAEEPRLPGQDPQTLARRVSSLYSLTPQTGMSLHALESHVCSTSDPG